MNPRMSPSFVPRPFTRNMIAGPLASVVFLLAPGLQAQTPAPAADPFAGMNRELARVVEFHLGQAAQTSGRRVAGLAAPRVSERQVRDQIAAEPASPERVSSGVALERVGLARRRLQALGVDAARIFVEEGVPLELLVVAGVESGYDPLARSPKGARGIWQLMPETAARFGLRVDGQTDERVHAVLATRAAARYLRELHLRFGDWQLALAAYNAGEARIAAAVQRSGTRDFRQLAGRGFLPDETRRYVPAVLAHSTTQ